MSKFDFEDRLLDYLDSLHLGFRVYADANRDASISVSRMPNSRVMQEYMDGSKDKRYTFLIQVKARDEQRNEAVNALQIISDSLIDLEQLPSSNNSYEFNDIIVTNEPYQFSRDDAGYIFFRMSIQADLYFKKMGDLING